MEGQSKDAETKCTIKKIYSAEQIAYPTFDEFWTIKKKLPILGGMSVEKIFFLPIVKICILFYVKYVFPNIHTHTDMYMYIQTHMSHKHVYNMVKSFFRRENRQLLRFFFF